MQILDAIYEFEQFGGMGTVAEIEKAITNLPLRLRRVLLRHLQVQFGQDGREKTGSASSTWPVPPPKVSKAESRKVAQRIADEFGRVEPENWK
jgi:hypothetical protein